MDAAAHYRHLLTLGRDAFLAAAAPAVLVRRRAPAPTPAITRMPATTMAVLPTDDPDFRDTVDARRPHGKLPEDATEMELYPLAKKPGAAFPDRITIGRVTHNDVVISEPSVSRMHAYIRDNNGWVIADVGSKNGSWLDDQVLEPRREVPLYGGAVLQLGDVRLMFYLSSDLFDLQGGDRGGR